VGDTNDALLRIDNHSTSDSATALNLRVEAGKAPMTVSAGAGKATNLNADEVDGKDSTAFFSGTNYGLFRSVSGEGGDSAEILEVNCDPGDMVLSGGGGASPARTISRRAYRQVEPRAGKPW
jgi:hypothetical protein